MGVSNWQEAHFNLIKVNLVVEVLDKNRPLTFLEFEAPAFDTRGTTFLYTKYLFCLEAVS